MTVQCVLLYENAITAYKLHDQDNEHTIPFHSILGSSSDFPVWGLFLSSQEMLSETTYCHFDWETQLLRPWHSLEMKGILSYVMCIWYTSPVVNLLGKQCFHYLLGPTLLYSKKCGEFLLWKDLVDKNFYHNNSPPNFRHCTDKDWFHLNNSVSP